MDCFASARNDVEGSGSRPFGIHLRHLRHLRITLLSRHEEELVRRAALFPHKQAQSHKSFLLLFFKKEVLP
jgi:hypothetical protein